METQKPLLKDKNGEEVDVHMYRSMIGSLMYLTSSRPDIMFAVYACARYQVNPKVSRLHTVRRIFSWDRKSTTGGCQFLRCRLISWQCKKQTVVANSITEAETPQQNGVTERRNRTLIEAARSMLADSKLPTTFLGQKQLILLVNVVVEKTSIELSFNPNMPALEDDSIFDFSRDDEDDGVVADMNNLDATIQVSSNPTTRIYKDHPLDQVIGDFQSATQTRKMSKNLEEHGKASTLSYKKFCTLRDLPNRKKGLWLGIGYSLKVKNQVKTDKNQAREWKEREKSNQPVKKSKSKTKAPFGRNL
ncbi:putative ribonuclease H-like domain-containing protein [Tanacetum coccineum]